MKRSLCWITSLGCCCAAAPVLAQCHAGAWMCATPAMAYTVKSENRLPGETLLLQYGAFALEKVDTPGVLDRLDLRPSWRLDNDARLSLKISKHQTELRLKWQW
ncbi:MAG: hypothetical protein HYZ18_03150 [Pseudogulbenkiania sp.]|nr:hypothetical protein [Pseudogulbenkiania sp.]